MSDPVPTSAAPSPRRVPWRTLVVLVLAAALPLVGLRLLSRTAVPRVTEDDVRMLVSSALQAESRQAFLITGALDLTVTTRATNAKHLRAAFWRIPLGSAESTVRAPGRVSYGIPVKAIDPDDIRLVGDTVELWVPAPEIYSVEPLLDDMDVETDATWTRRRGDARERVQQRAIGLVGTALERQAERHLADSQQPRIHTAEALGDVLRRAFAAAGMPELVFRFHVTERLQLTT